MSKFLFWLGSLFVTAIGLLLWKYGMEFSFSDWRGWVICVFAYVIVDKSIVWRHYNGLKP